MAIVLVVDEDSMVRGFVLSVLRRVGHTGVPALNVAEASDVLAKTKIDVVVMDIDVPGGSTELIGSIRTAHPGVPIILMTAGGAKNPIEARKRLMDLGVKYVLSKPFATQTLWEAVALALQGK